MKPWTIVERHLVWCIKDGDGNPVCYIDKKPAFYNGVPCGSLTSRGRTPEQLLQIARLISGAPKMEAALKAAHDYMLMDPSGRGSGSRAMALTKAALDEVAEGATPC